VEGIIVVSLALFLLSIQPLFNPLPLLEHSFFANILLPFITGRGRETLEMTAGLFSRSAGSV
jgi:hypothetical protein